MGTAIDHSEIYDSIPPVTITDAKIYLNCPGRNFLTVEIHTDQGLVGLGDGTLNGRELAVYSYLKEYLFPSLIGRDPFDTEDIWNYFYRGAYWRRGPITMTAIGAIDIALWDLKAKALKVPLYKLLGGSSRAKVMVYCHANGRSLDHAIDEAAKKQALGYKAIRIQSGVPGMEEGTKQLRASQQGQHSSGGNVGYLQVSQFHPIPIRKGTRCIRLRPTPSSRLPPSPDAQRSGSTRERPRALQAFLAGRHRPRGASRKP